MYFWNMGTIKSTIGDFLIHSRQTQENLIMVLKGVAAVEVSQQRIANLKRGFFIAEISFLTGESASADVHADGELFYVAWKSIRLKNLKHENPAFWMKLQHVLSEDLVKKVKPQAKMETQIEE